MPKLKINPRSKGRFARRMIGALRGFEPLVAVTLSSSLALAALEGLSLSLVVPLLSAVGGSSAEEVRIVFGISLGRSAEGLRTLCALLAVAVSLRAAAGFGQGIAVSVLEARLSRRMRNALLHAYHRIPYVEFLSRDRGQLANLHTAQVDSFMTVLSAGVSLFQGILLLAAYAFLLLNLSSAAAGAALAFVGLGAAPLFWGNRRIRELAEVMVESEERLNGLLLDDLGGRHVIQSLGLEPFRAEAHRRVQERLYTSSVRLQIWRRASKAGVEGGAAAIFLGGAAVVLGLFPSAYAQVLPMVMGFSLVLFRLQSRLHWIGESLSVLAQHRTQCESLLEFLEPDRLSTRRVSDSSTPGLVRLEGVSFSYGERQGGVHAVSFTLRAAEAVALVGRTGSGKTTLLNLLSGLMTPSSGRILREGGGEVGMVSEDAFVFDETIVENIRCGRDLSSSTVDEASRRAGLHEFVASLPLGYETPAGFRGSTLSAGQRQRLALARCLAGSPGLVLLDEATGNLDALTERSVLEAVLSLETNPIRVVVTHRMPLAREFPRILVMDGGRLVADGTHDELIAGCEVYRELCLNWWREPAPADRREAHSEDLSP